MSTTRVRALPLALPWIILALATAGLVILLTSPSPRVWSIVVGGAVWAMSLWLLVRTLRSRGQERDSA